MKLANGSWSYSQVQLAQAWVACFTSKFGHAPSPSSATVTFVRQEFLQNVTPILTPQAIQEAPFQAQELTDALFSCGRWKAPC